MTDVQVEAKIQAALDEGTTEFGLTGCGLEAVPESLFKLTGLLLLDLSANELQSLPESIGNLTQLQSLWLTRNLLHSLPKNFGNLTELQVLSLDENALQSLPESIGSLTQLQTLLLGENELKSLPESIGSLARLQELYLEANQLKSLPESIGNLKQLHFLNLGGNQLQTLPQEIGNLSNLEELNLIRNHLQSLPESLGNAEKLQCLYLDDNQLQRLPESIGHLHHLVELCLNNNSRLTSLPSGLRVNCLDISGCSRLSHLPDDLIVKEWIDVADSALVALPPTLYLVELRWRGIPITERIAFQPETVSHYEVFAETNAERRRVLIERMGYERFIREAEADVIDADQDAGGERLLFQIELQDDEPLVCLSVIDPSTGRRYLLRVPPRARTCQQAAAWIAGFDDPDDYRPLLET